MQISEALDRFESNFDDLDTKTGFMESAMASSTAVSTPPDQVSALIDQVAAENNLKVSGDLVSAPTETVVVNGERWRVISIRFLCT